MTFRKPLYFRLPLNTPQFVLVYNLRWRYIWAKGGKTQMDAGSGLHEDPNGSASARNPIIEGSTDPSAVFLAYCREPSGVRPAPEVNYCTVPFSDGMSRSMSSQGTVRTEGSPIGPHNNMLPISSIMRVDKRSVSVPAFLSGPSHERMYGKEEGTKAVRRLSTDSMGLFYSPEFFVTQSSTVSQNGSE